MKHNLKKIIVLSLLIHKSEAASTQVSWENTVGTELKNLNGSFLSSGTSNSNDGTILQLGYYTMATTLNPFAGVWVPLTGEGSGNAFYSTIGDKGLADGLFGITLSFDSTDPSIPTGNLPLTIRFYNSTTVGSSTYFNAVSNTTGSWNWITPVDPRPTINISLADSGLIWQDGSKSAFLTTIPIPEPSTTAILLLGAGVMAVRRRRK